MTGNKHGFDRSSGVLLPVSSLPSSYGIGSFGADACRWVDFLHEAGQSYWQILPLSPTGYGDSPYQSFSAFAGNPYFIDLEILYQDGLLDKADYRDIRWSHSDRWVDYGRLYKEREPVLLKAFSRFKDDAALSAFIRDNHWFEDYSLYMVIKAAQGQRSWMQWDEPLRKRQPEALMRIKEEHSEDIRYHGFIQYQFDRQWSALRAYANAKGVQVIGDIPIYVSLDSADVWANTGLFQLGEDDLPIEVSGCPPDSFAKDGQLWGNPLYDWDAMAEADYEWWTFRLRKSFGLFDVLRLDHFRGLESYFAIKYGAKTAEGGKWKPGPGTRFIDIVEQTVPEARIIAEDLGYLTEEVRKLLEYSTYPGMKIVQYAFDDREAGDYIPYKYEENSVVYPGTHDNDTAKGWSKNAPKSCIRHAMDYTGIRRRRDLPRGLVCLAMQSNSNLAIIPMQDWLGFGSRARLNTPSTVGGNNWRWRLKRSALSPALAEEMASVTRMYGR